MSEPFEDFVNAELPKRLSTNEITLIYSRVKGYLATREVYI